MGRREGGKCLRGKMGVLVERGQMMVD